MTDIRLVPNSRLRPVTKLILTAISVWLLVSTAAQSEPSPSTDIPTISPIDRKYAFDIGPQSLTSALERFGTITGIQIFYTSRLTEGKISVGLKGDLSAATALDQLLAGTGLTVHRASKNIVMLVTGSADLAYATQSPPSVSTLKLSTLRVEAPIDAALDHKLYATTLRFAIQTALWRDPEVRRKINLIQMDVWLAPDGTIQHFEFLPKTADTNLDIALGNLVHGIVVRPAPPLDLPQPIHVELYPRHPG